MANNAAGGAAGDQPSGIVGELMVIAPDVLKNLPQHALSVLTRAELQLRSQQTTYLQDALAQEKEWSKARATEQDRHKSETDAMHERHANDLRVANAQLAAANAQLAEIAKMHVPTPASIVPPPLARVAVWAESCAS
jgi:hypothetical protein